MRSQRHSSILFVLGSHVFSRWRAYLFYAGLLAIAILCISETVSHYRGVRYVRLLAQNVAAQTNSTDTTATVMALRDYIRQHVSRKDYPSRGRPFLRSSAEDTLRSGKGRCGEATRAFINMAGALGIHAQRLYLEGQRSHVVALVELNDRQRVIVDSSDRPYFPDLESLQQLSQHPEFNYYSSFNQRRMFTSLPPNAIRLGAISYYLENPHALKAMLWLILAAVCVGSRFLGKPLLNLLVRRRKAGESFVGRCEAAPASSGALG